MYDIDKANLTVVGENGVRLDKNFLFAIFLVVFFFFNFFFVCFVKCAYFYFLYFLEIFPFKNKVVLSSDDFKKSNFSGLFEKDGAKLDRLCLKL